MSEPPVCSMCGGKGRVGNPLLGHPPAPLVCLACTKAGQVSGRRRRVLLIEVDTPGDRWSSALLEAEMVKVMPNLRPVVFGEVGATEVDAAYRKLRQLNVETQGDLPLADRCHSAAKAMQLFRGLFPDRLWEWWEVGKPFAERDRLLR